MAISDLSTAELAKRLGAIKHGVGDPLKNNQVTRAAADRLRELDAALSLPPVEAAAAPVKRSSRAATST